MAMQFYQGAPMILGAAVLLSSCGGGAPPPPPQQVEPAPPNVSGRGNQAPAAPEPTPAEEATLFQDFEPTPIPGLIPSTDANNQRRVIAKGRQDPFTSLTLRPRSIERRDETSSLEATSTAPQATTAASRNSASGETNVSTSSSQPSSVTGMPVPIIRGGEIPQAAEPVGPPPPSAQTAKEVLITGIVTVSGRPQIILKAPNEITSRYVEPGQSIAGGQVLVKRVESGFNGLPRVILEENGIEVSRAVGEAAAQPPESPVEATAS
ncbi:MAG: hypothetical protein AAGG02_05010 [Cyanobacteria bacterium P01_H01_bin.15]